MAGKIQATALSIDSKHGDIVGPLVAAVQKFTGRIKIEAARIVASSPFIAHMRELTVRPDRKDSDAVVQAIARIDKLTVCRNQNF